MPTEALTPAQVAKLLDVHANTIRQWTSEYSEVLSTSAQARPRLLLPSDAAVLQLVQQLRAEGIAPSDVLERLRQTPASDRTAPYVDAAPAVPAQATETPTAPPVTSLAPVDVSAVLLDVATLVDTRLTATQEDIRRLDARVARTETQRLLWTGVAIGVALGLVLGVILATVLLRQ